MSDIHDDEPITFSFPQSYFSTSFLNIHSDLSCGILELAVITEYAHPQAFQDESLKLIPSRSLSDHLRVREKETRQDKYLSIRLDPENLSEFASQIFKEVLNIFYFFKNKNKNKKRTNSMTEFFV